MIIGIPKERKENEFRVGMVPAGIRELVNSGHSVLVEEDAGLGSLISNKEYQMAGAELVKEPSEVFGQAEMVVKVKEPLVQEYNLLRKDLILFTYLHLAPLPELTQILVDKGVTAIAYETVQDDDGFLPLLAPMSEVAGRMAIQVGAYYLEKSSGGKGVLLGGVPGVKRGMVMILGTGTVATNAALIAIGMGASVRILGRNRSKLINLEEKFGNRIQTLLLNKFNIEKELQDADLVVGAVLVPGSRTPYLITRDMLPLMQKGSVIVDVSIDQGGCVETSRPTFHSNPVFEEQGILHYCVANMPGAVPTTSTYALTGVTLPYIKKIADHGLEIALQKDKSLAKGVNVREGRIIQENLATVY